MNRITIKKLVSLVLVVSFILTTFNGMVLSATAVDATEGTYGDFLYLLLGGESCVSGQKYGTNRGHLPRKLT